MESAPKIPAVTQLIRDGYGPGVLSSVVESLRWMAASLRNAGAITAFDEAAILNLLMLEEAVLKDCYGIDLNDIV